MKTCYKIRELSARAVMRSAQLGADGIYTYNLSEEATLNCVSPSAPDTQEDCALFYQIMCVLRGEDFIPHGIMPDLADVLIYMDFSRVFDRKPTQKKYRDMQKQAEDMFRPEGVTLDFGRGGYRYVWPLNAPPTWAAIHGSPLFGRTFMRRCGSASSSA